MILIKFKVQNLKKCQKENRRKKMIDLFVKFEDEIVVSFVVAIDKKGKMYVDISKKDLAEMLRA